MDFVLLGIGCHKRPAQNKIKQNIPNENQNNFLQYNVLFQID